MGDFFSGLGISTDLVTIGAIYAVLVLASFWLAIILWAFRDMRSRSRDRLLQLAVALLVALLNVPGLLIYLLLRPRETLSESYERSLEEEALLQEIEGKSTCPACSQRVQEDWQACPHCFTRLKKPCVQCRRMLELSWQVCPYCTAPQSQAASDQVAGTLQHVRPNTMPEQSRYAASTARGGASNPRAGESLEFIDGDPY